MIINTKYQAPTCLALPTAVRRRQGLLYNPQMAVVHLRALAAYLISETATQDPKVGGPIRIAEITPEKGYQELDESIVNEIIKKNEEQNLKLRKFFFEG